MIRRTVIGCLLAALASPCFGQASLAVRTADGQFAGWYLAKKSEKNIQVLAPQGYLVTMEVETGRLLSNSSINRIVYESPCPGTICPVNPCGGRAFVELATGAEASALSDQDCLADGVSPVN